METMQRGDAAGESWMRFWGGEHSIYVNARHAQVHYEKLACDLARLLTSRQGARVLDWGCGDALNAPALVKDCSELLLYDAVATVQQRLQSRYAGIASIEVLDDIRWQSLPSASVDVVILNSVAQYMSRADLGRLLDAFRCIVRPGGEVIIADIIPTSAGMLPDVLSLLTTGIRHGFFLAACAGLTRTFFSEYRRIRKRAGFSTYDENEFVELLCAHGFTAERQAHNVGFNQQRMTFRAYLHP